MRKMEKTVPADYIGAEMIGYTLLAMPSEESKQEISTLSHELAAELPDGVLWPIPPGQLHVTVCQIIETTPYSENKEELFEQYWTLYENILEQILSEVSPFTITFDLLQSSAQAVIVRGSKPDDLNRVREEILSHTELPHETKNPPDILHATIARYLGVVSVADVQKVAGRRKIEIEDGVSEFKLVRTEVVPLEKYSTIRTFPLERGS